MSVKRNTSAQKQNQDIHKRERRSSKKLSEQDIYKKFEKAQQNMSNLKQMLTKFSTHRQQLQTQPTVKQFLSNDNQKPKKQQLQSTHSEPSPCHAPHPTPTHLISLSQGWQYMGPIFEHRFHGYGSMLLNGQTIYTGEFKHGRMDGMGKLKFCEFFCDLIDCGNARGQWLRYEGEFKGGNVSGFGNLYLGDGVVVVGYWRRGKPQYYTKVEAQTLIG